MCEYEKRKKYFDHAVTAKNLRNAILRGGVAGTRIQAGPKQLI